LKTQGKREHLPQNTPQENVPHVPCRTCGTSEELRTIAEAWPLLPFELKAAMMALVNAWKGQTEQACSQSRLP
jgi:hypothetical protein